MLTRHRYRIFVHRKLGNKLLFAKGNMSSFKKFYTSNKTLLFKWSLVSAVPAVLISHQHGLSRGLFFFQSIVILIILSLFIPYLRVRRKYGSNPFE